MGGGGGGDAEGTWMDKRSLSGIGPKGNRKCVLGLRGAGRKKGATAS